MSDDKGIDLNDYAWVWGRGAVKIKTVKEESSTPKEPVLDPGKGISEEIQINHQKDIVETQVQNK
jgi:hypothetical protein